MIINIKDLSEEELDAELIKYWDNLSNDDQRTLRIMGVHP